MFDMVVDPMREHPPMQPPRREIRSRCGERRAEIFYNPVLADRSITQQRLLDRHHRHEPEQEVFHDVSRRECDDWRANVKGHDGPTILSRSPA